MTRLPDGCLAQIWTPAPTLVKSSLWYCNAIYPAAPAQAGVREYVLAARPGSATCRSFPRRRRAENSGSFTAGIHETSQQIVDGFPGRRGPGRPRERHCLPSAGQRRTAGGDHGSAPRSRSRCRGNHVRRFRPDLSAVGQPPSSAGIRVRNSRRSTAGHRHHGSAQDDARRCREVRGRGELSRSRRARYADPDGRQAADVHRNGGAGTYSTAHRAAALIRP